MSAEDTAPRFRAHQKDPEMFVDRATGRTLFIQVADGAPHDDLGTLVDHVVRLLNDAHARGEL